MVEKGAVKFTSLILLSVASGVIFYLPYWINNNIDVVYRYWDGPNYAYLAKTLYYIPQNHPLSPYNTPEYFAAHLPLYPLAIRGISLLGFDYNVAMLMATVAFTAAATLVLYLLLLETRAVRHPFWSAIIALFIPARYLIYHSVGATEPAFLFLTLASLLNYIRGNYMLAFILGGLSGITRITGVLLGLAYLVMLIWEKKFKLIPLLGLIGFPLLCTFTFYHFHYGDFFAYFNVNLSNSNSLIRSTPLQIFSVYTKAGETHSAEFYLAMYTLYGAGTLMLMRINRLLFVYCSVIYLFSCFIFHQDLARYLIPIAPLALVVGFDHILSNRAIMFFSPVYIILCYVYAWGTLPHNLVVVWVFKNLVNSF